MVIQQGPTSCMGVRARLPLWYFNWYWLALSTVGERSKWRPSKCISTIFGLSNTLNSCGVIFKENKVEFQGLPFTLKTKSTGVLVLPGYRFTWIFSTWGIWPISLCQTKEQLQYSSYWTWTRLQSLVPSLHVDDF